MVRASPLLPQERRAAIIAATERLIVAQGGNVSTREIAKAAGIAEGTIFRVFATKDAIIDAIFEDAFNQHGFEAAIAGIDAGDDLEHRMAQLVAILLRRNRRIMALFKAIGFRRPPQMNDRQHHLKRERYSARIAAVIEPDSHRLRMAPLAAARLIQAMVIALVTPMVSDLPEYSPEELVDLILNGIARHPPSPLSESLPC